MARGKGEGSLYKQSDGLWAAYVTLPSIGDGKRRRKVVRSKSKPEVIRKLKALKKELEIHGDLSTRDERMDKWATHWLENIAAPEVRPKTYAGYSSAVRNYIIPMLGRKKLPHIKSGDVRDMLKQMQEMPKSQKLREVPSELWPEGTKLLGPDTAISVHGVLNLIMDAAMKDGLVARNVMEVVDRPRKAKAPQRALQPDEAIRLLEYLVPREDCALWTTYLFTGARRGEILGLERGRITDKLDLSWQLLRITDISKAPADYEYRHVRGNLYLTRPKSSAGWRVVPLVEPLRSVLALHLQTAGDGLVFVNQDGEAWDPDTASRTWTKILAAAGLPDDVTLHGARHTFVDLMFDAGADETVIQDIVGHSTRAMTRQYRTRGNDERAAAALEKFAERFGLTQ
ncbi:tyrosine-type recombinase/integrase [Glutamicibacter creatinolyticus]|uniref:tyrosine-type recombinase/integrase n=1 Tax=Glutamicibacter creatinolyticus TaxID=162496 RepID=UPI003217F5CF